MAVFWDPLAAKYEVAEISTDVPDVPVCLLAASWRGPLQMETVEKINNHNTIFIGYFGRMNHLNNTSVKKYFFKHAYTTDSGIPIMWLYTHCSGKTNLIIREVLPSPEIHVVIKSRHGVTFVTAVAENDRTILEMTVTEDVRCGEFKRAVKKKCVQDGLCTNQTNFTIYYENVLMPSNVMLRKDHDNKKRRLPPPKIIAAKDSSHWSWNVPEWNPPTLCNPVRNDSDWTVMVSKLLKNEGVGWWLADGRLR